MSKMWAVWKYDLYPFYLCGEVVNGPSDESRVQVKGYATKGDDGIYRGGWFTPEMLVSEKKGMELKDKFSRLKDAREASLKITRAEWRDELNKILPEKLQTEYM